MRKSIYFIELIDGKTIIATSRPQLTDKLHKYIIQNGKENEWYYINVNQLDCMIYNRVMKNRHKYIKNCGRCYIDEVVDTSDIKTTKFNGEPFKSQTIREKKNKIYNKVINNWIEDPTKCDIDKFNRLSVFVN